MQCVLPRCSRVDQINLIPIVRFPFGQHQEDELWPDPKQEVRESRTSNNGGCQRLLEWAFPATAHKLEMARVRVLGADEKESGLWGRDCDQM